MSILLLFLFMTNFAYAQANLIKEGLKIKNTCITELSDSQLEHWLETVFSEIPNKLPIALKELVLFEKNIQNSQVFMHAKLNISCDQQETYIHVTLKPYPICGVGSENIYKSISIHTTQAFSNLVKQPGRNLMVLITNPLEWINDSTFLKISNNMDQADVLNHQAEGAQEQLSHDVCQFEQLEKLVAKPEPTPRAEPEKWLYLQLGSDYQKIDLDSENKNRVCSPGKLRLLRKNTKQNINTEFKLRTGVAKTKANGFGWTGSRYLNGYKTALIKKIKEHNLPIVFNQSMKTAISVRASIEEQGNKTCLIKIHQQDQKLAENILNKNPYIIQYGILGLGQNNKKNNS